MMITPVCNQGELTRLLDAAHAPDEPVEAFMLIDTHWTEPYPAAIGLIGDAAGHVRVTSGREIRVVLNDDAHVYLNLKDTATGRLTVNGSGFAAVHASNAAMIDVRTEGTANVLVSIDGNAGARITALDASKVTVTGQNLAMIQAVTNDTAQVDVLAHDRVIVSGEARGRSRIHVMHGGPNPEITVWTTPEHPGVDVRIYR